MMVRLAFAVIAHVDADILIIDEALAVGDVFFTQKCMRFLRKFMNNGTILFVSHDTASVTSLCSVAILLNKGQISSSGDPKSVSEKYLEDIYGHNQAVSDIDEAELFEEFPTLSQSKYYRDVREGLVNSTTLRNDIELFQFDGNKVGFGASGAKITSVKICDVNGIPLSWLMGGQDVILEIDAVATKSIFSPIIGFQFKDRLGQILFADNTYLSFYKNPKKISLGQEFSAMFHFSMPTLPTGDYSFSAAIAEGTQEDHMQHHWIHDALTIKVHSSSICFGLMGIPMKKISLRI
jgi:lipopolysaccharide transport system ATP-binding protein